MPGVLRIDFTGNGRKASRFTLDDATLVSCRCHSLTDAGLVAQRLTRKYHPDKIICSEEMGDWLTENQTRTPTERPPEE